MSPRDVYFTTHHQAAHVVTAILLGCRVEFIDVEGTPGDLGWNVDAAAISDIETVCAAGFEMERLLGRLEDIAWRRSQDDRDLMSALCADRTGSAMTEAAIKEHFLQGAAASRGILDHTTARQAIDLLAEALSDAHDAGEKRLSAERILTITGLQSGAREPSLPA
jgi:hypothetical protein